MFGREEEEMTSYLHEKNNHVYGNVYVAIAHGSKYIAH